MMEETSDEQAELVSHEEAVLAEKEATQQNVTGTASILQGQTPTTLSAPSPLPAFLNTQPAPASPHTTLPNKAAYSSSNQRSSPERSAAPSSEKAPESPQIPHEGKRTETEENIAPRSTSGGSLFGWISSNSLVNRVVEKTKTSMETVITTLDPGMRGVIYSGGEIEIAVTSTKDNKVIPVREAFQTAFGKATVTGKASQATTAAQPVGFTAGLKGAEERIVNLRKAGSIPDSQTVVSVEGFIVEILPDKWFEMSCLLLKDPSHGIELQSFSQPTPIPTEYVHMAQDKTPSDYPLRWAGLAVTIGEVIESSQPHIGHADWQMVLSGVSRRQSLLLAAQSLAHMYKQKLPTSFIS